MGNKKRIRESTSKGEQRQLQDQWKPWLLDVRVLWESAIVIKPRS
jgi:hypothetical protein